MTPHFSRHVLIAGLAALLAVPFGLGPLGSAAPTEPWLAEPTGIGGTGRADGGEVVWTDFPFDDYGADTGAVGQENIVGLAGSSGDFRYPDDDPDDPRYVHNTADIVEVRAREVGSDLEVRVTLNALVDPGAVALGVAFEDPAAPLAPWPGDAGVASHWTRFIFVATEGGDVAPTVDLDANTLTFTASGASLESSRLVIGAGPAAAGSWLSPDEFDSGNVETDVRLFDLAFNSHELEPRGGAWREDTQSDALAAGDVSAFALDLDAPAPLPTSGLVTRVFRSQMDLGEGVDPDGFPQYRSPYQPYGLWIPDGYDERPTAGAPFLLTLHSLEVHHNQYRGGDSPSASYKTLYEQLGDKLDAVTATPLARGPDGWYWDEGLVDTFEVWNDVAAHYDIDPERTSVQGYSMGGYGTYRLITMAPDLFASAVSWVGPPAHTIWAYPLSPTPSGPRQAPGQTNTMLNGSLHVPTFIVHGTNDELVPVSGVTAQAQTFHDLGHPYRYALHPGQDHLSFVFVDEWSREAAWHGGRQRTTAPAQVTFTVRPSAWWTPGSENPELLALLHQLVAGVGGDLDSAYWVRDVERRDPEALDAVVDLTSHGIAAREKQTTEVLEPRPGPNTPHTLRGIDVAWDEAEPENRLSGTLSNVGKITIDVTRAGLTLTDCGPELDVTVDGPTELTLTDGTTSRTVTLHPNGVLICAIPIA